MEGKGRPPIFLTRRKDGRTDKAKEHQIGDGLNGHAGKHFSDFIAHYSQDATDRAEQTKSILVNGGWVVERDLHRTLRNRLADALNKALCNGYELLCIAIHFIGQSISWVNL